MSYKLKDISIKITTDTTFFMILPIQKMLIQIMLKQMKSHKKTFLFIYYIRYVTIKYSRYVKINSVNTLYPIFSKVNGYFEEINGSI